jgi:phytoene dehydrogenase-like protein
MASRARASGAVIEVGQEVTRVAVRGGTAYGVETSSGRRVRARRAVIMDTSAPMLYNRLLPQSAVPHRLRADLERFSWDLPTVKLNYRLHATIPWTAHHARGAGLVQWSADLSTGRLPSRPFALVGQMSTIDPSRSPAGTQAMWLYTHLPRGVTDSASAQVLVERTEGMLDSFAPGWRDGVIDRWVQRPSDLAGTDPNLGEGAVAGGTAQLFQQLVFRPVPGIGGPRTHVENLYLGSAATHPGGGVHGACGYLAARAALLDQRWWGRPRKRLELAALHRMYGAPGR